MTRQEAFHRLSEVREEFEAARFALGETLRAFDTTPALYESGHQAGVTPGNLESCVGNLEITYLLRLFAEFESVLRDYWLNGRKRTTRPPMIDLMNSLAAYCTMNADDVDDAHEVRDYRNEVVHQHLLNPMFDFAVCLSRLARFVRWLPLKW